MSTCRFPSLTSREFIHTSRLLGFETVRQTGSHVTLRHPDGRGVVVPVHGSRGLDRVFAKKLLRQADVSAADFLLGP